MNLSKWSLFVTAILFATSASALLQIEMQDGCPVRVVDTTPQPDCPPEAACRNRGQTVHWQRADNGQDFSIRMTDTHIFENWGQGPCPVAQGGQVVCRIADDAPDGDYKYDVIADGCPLDPRLIVR